MWNVEKQETYEEVEEEEADVLKFEVILLFCTLLLLFTYDLLATGLRLPVRGIALDCVHCHTGCLLLLLLMTFVLIW